mmetsp:Transcript_12425/g.37905  ORF Transcript_12425/g.37905 Transcript_12425/m.37905 type:complete len:236 (+) Transcript_12425:176-883(+)
MESTTPRAHSGQPGPSIPGGTVAGEIPGKVARSNIAKETLREALSLLQSAAEELQTLLDENESKIAGPEKRPDDRKAASAERKRGYTDVAERPVRGFSSVPATPGPKRKRSSKSISPNSSGSQVSSSLTSVRISNAAISSNDSSPGYVAGRLSDQATPDLPRKSLGEEAIDDDGAHDENDFLVAYEMLSRAFPSKSESAPWRASALALVEQSLPLEVLLSPSTHFSRLRYSPFDS